ncbi:MAG: ATP-dependent DNA helicase RecG [Oscillospiraceae bacterium]|nr:ATP-dependent DNA helicase RecG [Oscillospiraceae bacterium]
METQKPITSLPGVGKVRAEALARLGIETTGDLLRHFPRAYQHRGNVTPIASAEHGQICSTMLTIGTHPHTARLRGRMTLTKVTAFDESARCTLSFFNQEYLGNVFKVGQTYRFWGKVEHRGTSITLTSPQWEVCREDRQLPEFVAVYPLTAGITGKMLSEMLVGVLSNPEIQNIHDPIPERVREKYDLLPLAQALRDIHAPCDYAVLDRARRRFIFEELYLFCLAAQQDNARPAAEKVQKISAVSLAPLFDKIGFTLTQAQQRVIAEISGDMTGDRPMMRLLSGDVGSGKTVVAAAAAYLALRSGYQVAIMAPTEILATQHAAYFTPLFEELGYRTHLLTGALTPKQKEAVRHACREGELDVVVGTHALLTDDTVFANLGLVVTDELHRFGVRQKAVLAEKTEGAHVLYMSATPIPRTMAHIMYGSLDISQIDQMPVGRQRVDTFAVNENYRQRLLAFVAKQVEDGRQVYVVCPSVEDKEDFAEDDGSTVPMDFRGHAPPQLPLRSAVGYAAELQQHFPDYTVAFVHGKMKSEEKDTVMRRFYAGEVDILVSTTVIEVGVNVPNATLMIVENAERFGLSQLHQLRGRVGRGDAKSYCVLVSDVQADSPAHARLNVLCNNYDGYAIAEQDLAQRGPGDFFAVSGGMGLGERQHGSATLRFAGMCDDVTLLEQAVEAAKETVLS